jgi:putative phosphoesterase
VKVAVISDIHGNHYALDEVLSIAKKKGVSKLLVLGDIVGYYYHPDKVMTLLNDWDYELIKGNHENLLMQLLNKEIEGDVLKKKYGSGHQLALEKLSKDQIQALITAPVQKHIKIEGVNMLMCHGSSFDPDFYIYPDSEENIFKKCNDPLMDFVLIGHSHYPFIHSNLNSTLINVGSVGQSRILGGVANWALINTDNKCVELMSTSYDVKDLISDVNSIDPDLPYLKNILTRKIT